MLLGIIILTVIAAICGLPFLPVLVAGALGMSGLAYYLSKKNECFFLGGNLALVAIGHFLTIKGRTESQPEVNWVIDFLSSDMPLMIVAILTMFGAAVIGVFGPVKKLPGTVDVRKSNTHHRS